MKRYIEVCVRDDVSTTERGRVLERFARRFLETQNYDVVDEVRITGMEVDLLAQERTTGERIIVECKAQRSTIAADVLTKLYGKVGLEDFSSGC
jgi:Holliday junction resolvase-like predicted endonuclease